MGRREIRRVVLVNSFFVRLLEARFLGFFFGYGVRFFMVIVDKVIFV